MTGLRRFIIYYLASVLFILTFMPGIIEAQETNFNNWQAAVAKQNASYQKINDEARAQAKKIELANQKAMSIPMAKAFVGSSVPNLQVPGLDPLTGTLDPSLPVPGTAPITMGATPGTTLTEAQCQADPTCKLAPAFGVIAQETAVDGDTIPVFVLARNASNVAKVNLSISDPKTNTDYFKDSFINFKKQDTFTFSYNWDTLAAQTNPDSASTTHTAKAEFYKGDDKTGYTLIGTATANIKIAAFTGFNITTTEFWGAYLKNDGSYSSAWKTKLGCTTNATTCKDMSSAKTALAAGIANGKITEEDVSYLNDSFSRYVMQLNKNGVASSDEANTQAVVDYFNLNDVIGVANDAMDAKMGTPNAIQELSKETLMSPASLSSLRVLSKYSVQIASYNPQTVAELKAMPIWPKIQAEIENQMNRDPWNAITDLAQLAPPGSTTSTPATSFNENSFPLFLSPGKAQAFDPFGLPLDVAFITFDLYEFVQAPSWEGGGMLVVDGLLTAWDVFAGGGGEVHLAIAGARGVKALARVPGMARKLDEAKAFYETAKGSAFIQNSLLKIKGLKEALAGTPALFAKWVAEHPTLKAIFDKISPFTSKLLSILQGAQKKLIAGLAKTGEWITKHAGALGILITHAAVALNNACEKACPGHAWMLYLDAPIAHVICQMQCAIVNWFSTIIGYLFNCLLIPAMGIDAATGEKTACQIYQQNNKNDQSAYPTDATGAAPVTP